MILTKIIETAARYPQTVAVQMKVGDRYQQYTYAQLLKSDRLCCRSCFPKRGSGKATGWCCCPRTGRSG